MALGAVLVKYLIRKSICFVVLLKNGFKEKPSKDEICAEKFWCNMFF